MTQTYEQDIHNRLMEIVVNTCNKIGCDKCSLKWDGGCSATELESKIYEIERQKEHA
ncbi:hypothetical protein [Vibrio ziniensis]|uniref:Uncharacterized protein n=1 Tax=Vibrio ziniensis TaxID=2711221 RepID=A0A6G7CMZ6_9VIBR|nr:hypothetical protein [Vibrio ziniensis]QIH43479.1 hypothetical protein G5S32_15895 [Vibrio ziniensis]